MQPKFNQDLKDDKTFPYLEITTREDFPRVEFTRAAARAGHEAVWAVCQRRQPARGDAGAAEDLQVSHLHAWTSTSNDEKWRWFRPCLLASIDQCSAPCNLRISKEEYRRDIHRLRMFLEGNKKKLLGEMKEEMQAASAALQFEKAARLRDEIHMLETLDERGELDTHVQPEVFFVDPEEGSGRPAESARS